MTNTNTRTPRLTHPMPGRRLLRTDRGLLLLYRSASPYLHQRSQTHWGAYLLPADRCGYADDGSLSRYPCPTTLARLATSRRLADLLQDPRLRTTR